MKTRVLAVAAIALAMVSVKASAFDETSNKDVTDVVMNMSTDQAVTFVPLYQRYARDVAAVNRSVKLSASQKAARIENLKDTYKYKFAEYLDTESTEIAIEAPFGVR